jgi:hypothetical protein
MNRSMRAMWPRLVVVLGLALAGCGETIEPVPIVEVRVAHAAPGLGPANVLIEGTPTMVIGAGENLFFPVRQGTRTYEFHVGGQVSAVSVPHDADISAVVLMDRDDPTAFLYRLERRLGHPRLVVINGDFTTDEPMEVEIRVGELVFEATLDAGREVTLDPPAGTYGIRVRPGGGDEFLDIDPITLIQVDNGFLVLAPLPDPAEEYVGILF